VFETVLALDLKTKLPRLGFTAELSTAPFSDDNSAELDDLDRNLLRPTAGDLCSIERAV